MTGEEGSKILTFIGLFLKDNTGNALNSWLSDPFLGMVQLRLDEVVKKDIKEKGELNKEIEDLKNQIKNLNQAMDHLTAEPPVEVSPKKVKLNKSVKECVSEETVDEVMKEVKKK